MITAIRLSVLCSVIRQLRSIYKVKGKSSSIQDPTTTYKADQESHCTESRESRSYRQFSCSKMQTYTGTLLSNQDFFILRQTLSPSSLGGLVGAGLFLWSQDPRQTFQFRTLKSVCCELCLLTATSIRCC